MSDNFPYFYTVISLIFSETRKEDEAGTLEIGSQGLNLLQNKEANNAALDYDYEEELRKYQEMLETSDQPPVKETSRAEQENGQPKTQTETVKEAVKFAIQNLTSAHIYQHQQLRTQAPNSKTLQLNDYNQQQILNQQLLNQQQNLIPQVNYQQNTQGYSQNLQQGYPQQAVQQQVVQNYDQQYPQQAVQQVVQNYDQQQPQQQYYPQESNNAIRVYPPQPQATDRSGQYEPIGLKINFGGGNGRGLLGGNYSPLGIIGSILRPILPRPQVNLNGKLMFGVTLEKGVKFGDNKGIGGYIK